MNAKLRAARLAKTWTMVYVAENLGISSSMYGRWEHGKSKPNMSHLRKLCDFFEAKPEELGYTEIIEQSQYGRSVER